MFSYFSGAVFPKQMFISKYKQYQFEELFACNVSIDSEKSFPDSNFFLFYLYFRYFLLMTVRNSSCVV